MFYGIKFEVIPICRLKAFVGFRLLIKTLIGKGAHRLLNSIKKWRQCQIFITLIFPSVEAAKLTRLLAKKDKVAHGAR